MLLFCVTEPFTVEVAAQSDKVYRRPSVRLVEQAALPHSPREARDGLRFEFRPPAAGALSAGSVYVATPFEVEALARALRDAGHTARIRALAGDSSVAIQRRWLPRQLGHVRSSGSPFVSLERQLADFDARQSLRIAILNVFSPAFGDSICCLTLIAELGRRLRARFSDVQIDLLNVCFSTGTDALYARSGLVREIRALPVSVATLASYDAFFDFTAEYVRQDLPWIDGCLEAVGVEHWTVAKEHKRTRLSLDVSVEEPASAAVDLARSRGRPLLLFHPLASTPIRSMPPSVVPRALDALLDLTDYTVVSTVRIPFAHARFIDWSSVSSTFDHFAYLISKVDTFITVDTATYHVADAFDVPGIVLFTSIDLALRVSYYPFVAGIELSPGNRLSGVHFSERADDIRYAESLWEGVDFAGIVDALRSVVSKRSRAA